MTEPGKEVQQWVDPAMFKAEPMRGANGEDKTYGGDEVRPHVYLLQATPDPLGSLAAACMMYEGRVVRDICEVTDEDRRHYWAQSQKTHLKAPMEFIDFHFMVEGVTRSFTHQMVRQRTAVYAQESLRFAVKEGFADEVPLPPSLAAMMDKHDPSCEDEPGEVQIWGDAIATVEKAYEDLVDLGIPAEDARGLLPHSVTTRLNYKTNLRNLLDHIGNRLCTQAQFEWRIEIADLMRAIREYAPINRLDELWQFELIADSELFRPVCYSLGKCPFTADFDRGCTIRPRVEEGRFQDIDPAEWLLDPAAARRGVG